MGIMVDGMGICKLRIMGKNSGSKIKSIQAQAQIYPAKPNSIFVTYMQYGVYQIPWNS